MSTPVQSAIKLLQDQMLELMTEIINNAMNVEMFWQEVGQSETLLYGHQLLADFVNGKENNGN
jgi:hypothetical protein